MFPVAKRRFAQKNGLIADYKCSIYVKQNSVRFEARTLTFLEYARVHNCLETKPMMMFIMQNF